jgi:hypothetical protein
MERSDEPVQLHPPDIPWQSKRLADVGHLDGGAAFGRGR